MKQIRVISISTVQPEPTTAGQVKLYRHLTGRPEIELLVYPTERRLYAARAFRHRLVARLERTASKRWIANYELLRCGRWLDNYLLPPENSACPTVVVTMAHGNGCWAALRYAQKHRLPLVTFYDDWWPDMAPVHSPFRNILEKKFRNLYSQSKLVFCISEEMQAELGCHKNSHVLYPIPQETKPLADVPAAHDRFLVAYFGNLGDYGTILQEALITLRGHPRIRLEVRGGGPSWPLRFQADMKKEKLWHDYAPRAELEDWLRTCDAFLVPMLFEPAMQRRMETSFPSKLLEMSQLRKPIVIWGPEYCSAVKWGRRTNRALCITDPNPSVFKKKLEELADSPEQRARLAAAAQEAAQTEFDPHRIHQRFMTALLGLVQLENA